MDEEKRARVTQLFIQEHRTGKPAELPVPEFSIRDLEVVAMLSEAITAMADGRFYTAHRSVETALGIIERIHINID